jgi:hypothetical protein
MKIPASAATLLLTFAAPVRAQNVHDVAAYFGSVLSTPGAAATVAEQPILGDNIDTWGLSPFYTHESLGGFGTLSPFGTVSTNVFGGSLFASILGGRLGLVATGAYINPNCPDGFACKGFATVGGTALLRLLRAPMETDPGARVTLSLRAAGGWAFAPDSDRYASASVGVPIALSASEGAYRVVAFVSPSLVWGTFKTLVPSADLNSLVLFDHEGVRGMLSGGLAFVPSRSGVGVHLGFQRMFVDHAGTQYSVALSWNMPKLGDR